MRSWLLGPKAAGRESDPSHSSHPPRLPTLLGAALLILLGAARGIGGLLLLAPAGARVGTVVPSSGRLVVLGLGLVAVAFLCSWSGVSLLRRRPDVVPLALVSLAAFVVGGVANGAALYGALQPAGLAVNLIVAAVIAALLLIGQRSRRR